MSRGFQPPDFNGIVVRSAETACDQSRVAELRRRGFGRHLSDEERDSVDWLDENDRNPDTTLLLATTVDDEPVATLRLSSGRERDTGLASYVPLNRILHDIERPYVQFARLSAPRSARARDAMFALFKSAWRISERTGHKSIVLAAPPWARRTYELLQFRDVGDKGEFVHAFGRPVPHRTMVLPIHDIYNFWRSHSNPLCDLFFDNEHAQLTTRI
jgi:predicted GNAT family N-acyltransferase